MKVKLTLDIDTVTGDYEVTYNSEDKRPIEASTLSNLLTRVLKKFSNQLDEDMHPFKTRD